MVSGPISVAVPGFVQMVAALPCVLAALCFMFGAVFVSRISLLGGRCFLVSMCTMFLAGTSGATCLEWFNTTSAATNSPGDCVGSLSAVDACMASNRSAYEESFTNYGFDEKNPPAGNSLPTSTGDTASFAGNWGYETYMGADGGAISPYGIGVTSVSGSCPATCPTGTNIDILTALAGGYCVSGCGYTNGADTLRVTATGAGFAAIGQAVPTGSTCTTTNAQQGTCGMGPGGVSVCVNQSGTGAVINGDVVPASLPSNSCLGYPDGSVICSTNSLTAPPAPGASGSPDSPSATVTNGTSSTASLDWFSSGQVASSASSVITGGEGSGGVSGDGSGTGSGASSGCSVSGSTVTCMDDGAYGGMDCSAPPVCQASDAACNIDLQSWLARCPQETLASLAGAMAAQSEGLPSSFSDLASGASTINVASLSTSGPFDSIGTGYSACPTGVFSMPFAGTTVSLDPLIYWFCRYASTMDTFILAIAAFVSMRIMLSALLSTGGGILTGWLTY
jgi:hypothetical protein